MRTFALPAGLKTALTVVATFSVGFPHGRDVGPPDGSRDDWETFERQFAEYVAARARRSHRFPRRR